MAYPSGSGVTGEPINILTDSTGNNLYPPGFYRWTPPGSAPSTPTANYVYQYAKTTNGFTRLVNLDASGVALTDTRDLAYVVYNPATTSAGDIAVNQFVYATGATTNYVPTVALAKADSLTTLPAIGVTITSCNHLSYCKVQNHGIMSNLVLGTGQTSGQPIYISDTTAGSFTATRPQSPHYAQRIGNILCPNNVCTSNYLDILLDLAPAVLNHDSGTDQTNYRVPNIYTGTTTATNQDNRGSLTLVAGTKSYTFTQGNGVAGVWTTAPICQVQDQVFANQGNTTLTVTASTLTIANATNTTDTYTYLCWPGN